MTDPLLDAVEQCPVAREQVGGSLENLSNDLFELHFIGLWPGVTVVGNLSTSTENDKKISRNYFMDSFP